MTDFAPPRPPSNRPPSLAELSAGKLGAPGTTVSSGTKLFDPNKVKLGSQAPPAPRGLLTQVWDVIRGAPMGLVQLGGKAAQTFAAPLHYTYDMAFNRDDYDSVDGVGDFLNQYMPVVDLLADSAGETLGRIRHPSRYLDAIEEGRIVDAILNDVGNIALAGGAIAKGVGAAGSATTAASLRSTIQAGVADGTIGQTAAQAALRGAARVEQGSGIAGALSRSGNVAAAERLTGVGNVIRQGTRTLNTIADTPFPAVRWAGGKLGDIAAPAVERVVSARLERPYTIPRQGGRIPLSEVLRHSVVGTDLANSRVVSRLTPQGRDFQQNISADLVNRTLQAQMAVSEVGTAAEQLARDNDLPASRQDPTYLRLTSAAVLDTFGVLEQQLQGWTARYNAAADQVQRDAVFEDIYNEVTRLYADAPDSRVIPRPEVVRTILDERSGTLAPNERAFIAGMRPAVAKLYAQGEQMGVEGIGGRKITDEEMGSEVLSIEAQRQRAARERELAAVDRQMVGQRERAARDERLANVQRAVAEAFDDPPALKGITDRQRAAARQDVELARAQDALREERRSLRELQSRLRQEVRDGAADVDRRITEVERAVARVNELRTLEAAALARWREAQAATPPDTPPPGGPADPPPQPPTPDGGVPPVAPTARAVEPDVAPEPAPAPAPATAAAPEPAPQLSRISQVRGRPEVSGQRRVAQVPKERPAAPRIAEAAQPAAPAAPAAPQTDTPARRVSAARREFERLNAENEARRQVVNEARTRRTELERRKREIQQQIADPANRGTAGMAGVREAAPEFGAHFRNVLAIRSKLNKIGTIIGKFNDAARSKKVRDGEATALEVQLESIAEMLQMKDELPALRDSLQQIGTFGSGATSNFQQLIAALNDPDATSALDTLIASPGSNANVLAPSQFEALKVLTDAMRAFDSTVDSLLGTYKLPSKTELARFERVLAQDVPTGSLKDQQAAAKQAMLSQAKDPARGLMVNTVNDELWWTNTYVMGRVADAPEIPGIVGPGMYRPTGVKGAVAPDAANPPRMQSLLDGAIEGPTVTLSVDGITIARDADHVILKTDDGRAIQVNEDYFTTVYRAGDVIRTKEDGFGQRPLVIERNGRAVGLIMPVRMQDPDVVSYGSFVDEIAGASTGMTFGITDHPAVRRLIDAERGVDSPELKRRLEQVNAELKQATDDIAAAEAAYSAGATRDLDDARLEFSRAVEDAASAEIRSNKVLNDAYEYVNQQRVRIAYEEALAQRDKTQAAFNAAKKTMTMDQLRRLLPDYADRRGLNSKDAIIGSLRRRFEEAQADLDRAADRMNNAPETGAMSPSDFISGAAAGRYGEFYVDAAARARFVSEATRVQNVLMGQESAATIERGSSVLLRMTAADGTSNMVPTTVANVLNDGAQYEVFDPRRPTSTVRVPASDVQLPGVASTVPVAPAGSFLGSSVIQEAPGFQVENAQMPAPGSSGSMPGAPGRHWGLHVTLDGRQLITRRTYDSAAEAVAAMDGEVTRLGLRDAAPARQRPALRISRAAQRGRTQTQVTPGQRVSSDNLQSTADDIVQVMANSWKGSEAGRQALRRASGLLKLEPAEFDRNLPLVRMNLRDAMEQTADAAVQNALSQLVDRIEQRLGINYFNRALSEWDQSLADLAEMRRRAEAGQLTNAEFSELTGGINASRFAMGGTASKSVPRKLQDAVAYVERMVIAARSRTITRARNEGVELADAQPPVAPEAAVPPRPVPSIAEVAAPLRPEQAAGDGAPPPPDTPPTQAGGGDAPPPGPDVAAARADYEATRGRRLEAQRNQRSVVGRLATADRRARERLSDADPNTPRRVVYREHGRVDPDTDIGQARADAVPSLAKLDQQEVSSRVQRAQQRVANAERKVEVKQRTAKIARNFADMTDDEKTLYAKYRRPRDRNGNVRAASYAENMNRRLGAAEERARVSAARLKQLEDRRTAVLREIADIPVTLARPVQARIRDLVHGRSKTLSLNDQGLKGPIKPGDWIELPNGKWGRVVDANMEVVRDAQGRVVIDKTTGEPQEQFASWEVDMGGGRREQVEPGDGWRWRSDKGGAVGTLRRQLRGLAPPVGTVRTIEVDTWKGIDPELAADMAASGMGDTRYRTEVRGKGLIYDAIMDAAARSGVDPVRIVQNIEALRTDRARIVALGEAADEYGFTPEQIDQLNRSVDVDERMVLFDDAVAGSHAEGTWIDLPLELGRMNEDLGWAPQEWHNARHKQMHRFVDARVRTLADNSLSVQAMPARWRPVAIMARRQIKVMLDDAQRLSDDGLNARPLLAMAAEIATNMADLAALNIDPRYVIGGVPARMGQAVDSLRPRPLRSDYQRRTPYAPLDLEDMQATQLETMVQRHRNHTYAEAERRYGRSLSQIPELTDWLTTFVQDNNRYPSSNEFIDAAKQAGWVPLQRGRGLGATEAVDLVGQLDEDLRLASELHEQAIASGDTARIQRTRFQMEEVASRLERAKRVTPVELRNAWQAFDRARQDMERLAAQGADTDALAAAQTRLDNATMVLGEAEAAALPTLVPDAIATEMARDASLWDRGMLPGFKLLAKSNRFFKNQVLPLSFRWYLNNALGNVLMAAAFGGVGPRQLATMVGQLIKDTGVTGAGRRSQIRVEQALLSGALDVGTVRGARIQQSGLLESQRRGLGLDQWDQASDPRTRVGRGVRAVTDRGYGINEFMDNMYRSSVYLAKIEQYLVKGARNKLDVATPEGVQRVAEAALRDTLKAMGDYTNMAPWQRKYLRQIFPWWSWIRHSTIAAMRLPVENPIRTLWLAQLSGLANEEGLSGDELAFFGGRWMLDDGRSIPLVSLSPLEDVTQNPIFNPPGLIRSIAPAIKIATVATTGLDLGRITQVSQPPDSIKRGVFGQQVADPLIYDPAALAGYAVGQFPMLRNLRDVLEQPSIRYGTGQPILDKQGAPKPSGRTRLGSLAAIFGIPAPEMMTLDEAQRRRHERVTLSQ